MKVQEKETIILLKSISYGNEIKTKKRLEK